MKDIIIHIGFTDKGTAKIGNRIYWWDYHPYWGPTFLRKDGEPLRRQPGPKNPVWEALEVWKIAHGID